jgi:hypothetical protein
MSPDAFTRLAKFVPVGQAGWFDLLYEQGSFQHWLASKTDSDFNYALWLLSQREVLSQRGKTVAELLRDILSRLDEAESAERKGRVLDVFAHIEIDENREMFQLFLELLSQGCFDHNPGRLGFQFHDLPEKNSNWALELLLTILDHYGISPIKAESSDEEVVKAIALPDDFVDKVARMVPDAFVQHILPRIVTAITTHEVQDADEGVTDSVWPWLTLGFRQDFKWSLLDGVEEAMKALATESPDKLDQYTEGLEKLPHRNITFLLLSGWAANAARYSEKIAEILLEDSRRLNIGYGAWSTGNGIAAISRGAIAAASPRIPEPTLRRLESAILDFYTTFEREDPKRLGYTQSLLLHAIDPNRIGEDARRRLQELERKFPQADLSKPTASNRAGVVRSPIPEEAEEKMTDDQWISAMLEYHEEWKPLASRRDFMTGGAHELSQRLEARAKENKVRFAALTLKMTGEIQPVYFNALLRALVARHANSQGVAARNQPELPKLESESLFAVFRHVHELPDHPCGRWLSAAVGDVADRNLPDEIVQVPCFYAREGKDPEEAGDGEKRYFSGDLVTYGINTTRGAATHALSDLLLADPKRWPIIRDAVLSAVEDRSWSVRAVAVSCLIAVLNIDRDFAVKSFLKIANEAPEVLGSMFVERFLYYAVFSHFGALRNLLLAMLENPDSTAREASARAICIASLRLKEAEEELSKVFAGDEVCRAAVATIAAGNLQYPEVQDRCREWLKHAFNDESEKVRGAASRCFHEITDEQLCEETELIDVFLESRAFQEHVHGLMISLERSVHKLPDVICKIPEKAVAIHEVENTGESFEARWWTHQMASLVLRLYDQTRDPKIKSRCLDVIDKMIELDFGNVTSELTKMERA